ncbi:glycosyl hydrolase 115 family protein [Streptomyces sp. NPDC004232]|uniref:glycosyl hydrolase 115 family protein n=1 Tax=Streptomyces sp. NPDC004232 TaxID=3154454 RepID=UPI001DAF85D1|nr:glycosyl hydrolase 115 family protein [Streptomyces sp. tea 10]
MDRPSARRPSRRSVLGIGVAAASALATTPLGSPLGLSATAWAATPTGPVHAADVGGPEATDPGAYISAVPRRGSLALVAGGHALPIVVCAADHPGVLRAVGDLRSDLESVTGVRPALTVLAPGAALPRARECVVIGTIGRSPLVDRLVGAGKLDVTGVRGAWETTVETIVEAPFPGVDRAFVIAGSDQRGTIYGVYDVSRGIGVSPWSWWDDIVPQRRTGLHVLPGRHTQGTPAVKYRGFFINDENPALGGWAPAYFGPGKAPGYPGGFNAAFYAKVFELMLRLKANYLWPAVWGRAFALDDPANHATAKAYGIVMGTSHEAPMMRGIEEWNRFAVPAQRDANGTVTVPGSDPYGGTGEWSFRHNADALKKYWTAGIQRMVDEDFEGVVTLGMRGNGDTGLADGDGIDLMQQIIATQRQILADVTSRDVTTIPQVWTLYKEVERYWKRGLRVPDDVTVVFTDDNWANTRMLPDPAEPVRSGNYGLYYHFDYVGSGRDYKWVDTASLPNVWDQLNQSHTYGNHGVWVANVGDLKGNELPTQFFLDYAWNPDRWGPDRLDEWLFVYSRQNFGAAQAAAVADILARYGQLQSRRKPELLNRSITLDPGKDLATDPSAVVYDDQASAFSVINHRELERVTAEWCDLANSAQTVADALPPAAQDGYFELVGYEVLATANVYALRQAEFANILHAGQGRADTNRLAEQAEHCLATDFALADRFNSKVAGGKWKGFQTQPHIDYGDVARYGPNAPWQEPELNNRAIPDVIFPPVRRLTAADRPALGLALEGSAASWPGSGEAAVLPSISPYQTAEAAPFFEIFNRGGRPFTYRVTTGAPWLSAARPRGLVTDQVRLGLVADWSRAPQGTCRVPVSVTGSEGTEATFTAVVENPGLSRSQVAGFVEAGGHLSIGAEQFDRAVGAGAVQWQRVPRIGRTGDGMEPFPVTADRQVPGGASPRLEYTTTLFTTGPVVVWAHLSPRNPALARAGLHYAVSFDDEQPQVVDIIAATGTDDGVMNMQWQRNTSDNVNRTSTTHTITRPGVHTLKFWMVDPTVVLQELVVDTGGLRPSLLAPPRSLRVG